MMKRCCRKYCYLYYTDMSIAQEGDPLNEEIMKLVYRTCRHNDVIPADKLMRHCPECGSKLEHEFEMVGNDG